MSTPAPKFTAGQAVSYAFHQPGRPWQEFTTVVGSVVQATLVGKRHPGYVYEVALPSGLHQHLAEGLLAAA